MKSFSLSQITTQQTTNTIKTDLHKHQYDSRKEKTKYKNKRRRIRQRQSRIIRLKQGAHKQIAKDLFTNYSHILIARFRVSEMIVRGGRKINSPTVRRMLQWSHYDFRQQLKHKAELMGVKVFEVSEYYTSKTCGGCGKLDQQLGGKKHYKCKHCSFQTGRDWNGARNIYILNVESFVGLCNFNL